MTVSQFFDPQLPTPDAILGMIDHALLHPTLTDDQMRAELATLRRYKLASVCIKPYAVPLAVAMLKGTEIATGTVIGFPHGSSLPVIKAREAKQAFADGAHDVDMVVNIGKVLSNDWSFVRDDVNAVLQVARERDGILKVIFETDYLTDDAVKIRLCEICSELDVDFVQNLNRLWFRQTT